MSAGEELILTLRKKDFSLSIGLFLVILSIFCFLMLRDRWIGLNQDVPLLAGLPAAGSMQESSPPSRIIRRLVMVVVDGLNAEYADRLPALKELSAQGLRAWSLAPGPTFTRPSHATWLTGLDPVDSGIRTNRFQSRFVLDSIVARAYSKKLQTMSYDEKTPPVVGDLFEPYLNRRWIGRDKWQDAVRAVSQVDLSVFSLASCDEAAHRAPIQDAKYQDAIRIVDKQIKELRNAIDLKQDVFVVVNDHGQIAQGGHGGSELQVRQLFVILAGAGIARRSDRLFLEQKDLAPTLAPLLGLESPAHNRGWPASWMLSANVDDSFRHPMGLSHFHTRYRVERYLNDELKTQSPWREGMLQKIDLNQAIHGFTTESGRLRKHLVETLREQADRSARSYLQNLRRQQANHWIVYLAGALLLILAAHGLQLFRIRGFHVVLGLLLGPLVLAISKWAGIQASLSAFSRREMIVGKLALIAFGVSIVYCFILWIRARAKKPCELCGGILFTAWIACIIFAASNIALISEPGAALADLTLIAASLLAGVSCLIYLSISGLFLMMRGFVRKLSRSEWVDSRAR